jgi:hypothetical protein
LTIKLDSIDRAMVIREVREQLGAPRDFLDRLERCSALWSTEGLTPQVLALVIQALDEGYERLEQWEVSRRPTPRSRSGRGRPPIPTSDAEIDLLIMLAAVPMKEADRCRMVGSIVADFFREELEDFAPGRVAEITSGRSVQRRATARRHRFKQSKRPPGYIYDPGKPRWPR